MPNYKEKPVAGRSWTRCSVIHIANPVGGEPTITFQEERVTELADGERVSVTLEPLQVPFEPQAAIPIRDPDTGAPLGPTRTQRDLYLALYSLYQQAAEARDIVVGA